MSRRGVTNFQQRLGLTHFLRIPVATGNSYFRVGEAYDGFKRDPLFHVIPKDAFIHADNLHFLFGTLRLDDAKHIDAACSLLREFEQDGWRQIFRALSEDSNRAVRPTSTVRQLQTQPFKVNLVGVGGTIGPRSHNTDLSRSMRLYTYIQESTDALEPFCRAIYWKFKDKGINISDQTVPQMKLVNTGQAPRSNMRDLRPSLVPHQNQYLEMSFDAREIAEKYRGVPWVEDVPLQEIRITAMGRPRKSDDTLLRHTYNDVATFKLPGFYETRSKSGGH